MGIHIFVKKIKGKTLEQTWGNKNVWYYDTESQEWFDSLRYTGDRDFVVENDFIAVDTDNEVGYQTLFRPKDFQKSKDWVVSNVVECNQYRLIEALNKMELDKDLVFSWSW